MAYSTTSDVEALTAKFPSSGSSTPNTTQLEAIIDNIDAEIDLVLESAGVSTPVTSPTAAVNWLKKLSSEGSAATYLRSMFPDAAGPGETPAYAYWEKRYQDGLKSINDGMLLTLILGAQIAPSTYLTNNPEEEEDIGELAEPQFKIDKVF